MSFLSKQRNEKSNEAAELATPPVIDLYDNPSAFNVFSHVRKIVLEYETKKTSQVRKK